MTPTADAEHSSDAASIEKADAAALERLREALERLERGEGLGEGQDALSIARLEEEEEARQTATRSLNAAPRTRFQLEAKLAAKGIDEDVAARVLDRYEEVGLIDDAAFAREWVRTRTVHKNIGPAALREELRRKGVDERHIDVALIDLLPPEAEADNGLELARAKAQGVIARSRGKDLQDGQERQKLIQKVAAAVARKGYGMGEAFEWARRSVDEHLDHGPL